MNWSLSISYPWWFLFLCICIGLLYAGLLYYKSKDAEKFSDKSWAKWVLPSLRFLLASILSFFLLAPILKYVGFISEKPILAVIIDNSQSIQESDNSSNKEELALFVAEIENKLDDKFDVDILTFSNYTSLADGSSISLDGSETNISSALNYLSSQYVNQNLGASILVTDGIYNAGNDPLFGSENIKHSIYTVGVGDTTIYSDFLISNISHNSIAYLGNEYPIRIEVKASKLQGKAGVLQLFKNGALIKKETISIGNSNFFYETDITTKAEKIGQNKMEVRLSIFENEKNISNNQQTFYVDVVDSKKKIAIWSNAPHPDIGMFKSVINSNDNYETSISFSDYTVKDELDLVILHNWFVDRNQLNIFEKLKNSGIPVLVVLGEQFNPQVFNAGSQPVKFSPSGRGTNAALPVMNSDFEYFEINAELNAKIKKWSPLKAPFGKFRGIKPADIVMHQTIGSVSTQEPLLALTDNGGIRFGLIAGTGIWQWRMLDYEKNSSHEGITELVSKMVQYLAVKEDKKLLKVYPTARQYGIGETITIIGELYNQSLDPVANQEIEVDLINEKNQSFKHIMNANGNQYRLVLKNIEEGAYRFNATAKVGGVTLTDKGTFTLLGQQKEKMFLTADFPMLKQLAANSGGKFFTLSQTEDLIQELQNNDGLKTVISEENKLEELIQFKWLFWLILGLLSLEWFTRKWLGGY